MTGDEPALETGVDRLDLGRLAEDRYRAAAAANTMQFFDQHREKLLGKS